MTTQKVKLLPWQSNALQQFNEDTKRDFVLIAGTGTGKTTAGAAMALSAFTSVKFSRKKPLIIVFCPFRSIKDGWTRALTSFKLFVAEKPQEVAPDRDAIVTTYAGAGPLLAAIFDLISTRELIFVFDEFHHLEENGTWADPIINGVMDPNRKRLVQFDPIKRIFLSGTPWREEGEFPVSLVPYKDDEVIADFTHSYGENVNLEFDNGKNTVAVRFEKKKMEVEFQDKDNDDNPVGTPYKIKTSDTIRSSSISPFVRFETYKQLTKLEGVTEMIDDAVAELDNIRRNPMPRAGGIVFVSGRKEGDLVKYYLEETHGKNALFVKSDDPKAHSDIKTFAKGNDEWIIAIDMIAEGTDIPRLKVAIDLSCKKTMMHIIQRWGRVLRLVRDSSGGRNSNVDAVVYCVDHAQLRYVSEKIEAEMKRFKRKVDNPNPPTTPPAPKNRELISSTSEDAEAVFKGKKIAEQARELALWMIFSNYGGRAAEVGFAFALAMAETLISTSTVPKEFFEQDKEARTPSAPPSEDKRREFQDAVTEYTEISNRIAKRFFDNDYSASNNLINREMRIQFFSKKNATIEEVKARVEAAKVVERRLNLELTPNE